MLESKDTLDEDTNDLHRAFKMSVEIMKETKQLEEIKLQVIAIQLHTLTIIENFNEFTNVIIILTDDSSKCV